MNSRWKVLGLVLCALTLAGCGSEMWTSAYVTEDGTHVPTLSAMVSVRTDNTVQVAISGTVPLEGRLEGTTLYSVEGIAVGELERGRTAKLTLNQGMKTYRSVLILGNNGATAPLPPKR